jgi:hypothetical protein
VARLALGLSVAGAGCLVQYTTPQPNDGDNGGDEAGEGDEHDDGDHECEEFEIDCDGECVNLFFDDDNCGECGLSCQGGSGCAAGVCVRTCEQGCDPLREQCDDPFCVCRPEFDNCGGNCVAPWSNPDHCGGCFVQCADPEVCGAGECHDDCDGLGDSCDDLCTDLSSDPLNCGECDFACPIDALCVESECRPYFALEDFECFECPCEDQCPEFEDFSCCESEFVGGLLCIEGPVCPP